MARSATASRLVRAGLLTGIIDGLFAGFLIPFAAVPMLWAIRGGGPLRLGRSA